MGLTRPAPEPAGFPVTQVAHLDDAEATPRWLVHSLWAHQAVGFLGGAPKACKSWLGLDLAVSVASGTAALGRFPVDDPGPALVYLAEDALPQVRQRVAAIAGHRALPLHALDLYAITAPTVRLDLPADQRRLAATVAAIRPRLLLLDPLVRLHRVDENNASEISGLLGFLRQLQREAGCAIVLVHHLAKKHRVHLGQALRGSSDLFAWADSNAYLVRQRDHGPALRVTLSVEHRSAPAAAPVSLTLVEGPHGNTPHLEIVDDDDGGEDPPPAPLADAIRQILARSDQPLSRQALRETLHVNNQRLGQALAALEQRGLAARTPAGWTLPPLALAVGVEPHPATTSSTRELPARHQLPLLP